MTNTTYTEMYLDGSQLSSREKLGYLFLTLKFDPSSNQINRVVFFNVKFWPCCN